MKSHRSVVAMWEKVGNVVLWVEGGVFSDIIIIYLSLVIMGSQFIAGRHSQGTVKGSFFVANPSPDMFCKEHVNSLRCFTLLAS